MREFTTAARDAADDADDVDQGGFLPLDGVEYRYYRATPEQIALYLAESVGRSVTDQEKTAASINFFFNLFDEESRQKLGSRLLDRDDKFDLEMVGEITQEMIAEWAGRPTVPSSGSTRSRTTGGRKSSPRTRQLT